MDILFVEAKRKSDIGEKEIENIAKKLPDKVHILYTIQYKNIAKKIRKKLGKKVLAFQQVLGCSKIKPKAPLLLVGSGKFHALSLALSTKKPVLIWKENLERIGKKDIQKFKLLEKGKLIKFFSSESIGILVSLKPGQNKLKEAIKLKQKMQKKFKEKNFYIFVFDTLDIQELENFPCFFTNLACPGIALDKNNIINYEILKKFSKKN